MSSYIDIEILHTLPFSNSNRDDAGLPKTVTVGGSTRGRLSSQSIKRASRYYGLDRAEGYGLSENGGAGYFRTKYIANAVEDRIKELDGGSEAVERVRTQLYGDTAFGKLSKPDKTAKDQVEKGLVLSVVTTGEVDTLAHKFIEGDVTPAEILDVLKSSAKKDIALWGRFFASANSASLDGSAQVAHAITTHSVNTEADFFVGMDDLAPVYSEHGGGGHPDDSFYLTGTFYKYANINLDETIANLLNLDFDGKKATIKGDRDTAIADAAEVIEKFIRSFALSVPQGKIRSSAHQTLPSYIRVSLRNDRPVNASTAFDSAIPQSEKNIAQASLDRLATTHASLNGLIGEPVVAFVWSSDDAAEVLGDKRASLNELVSSIIATSGDVVEKAADRFIGLAE